MGKTNKAIQYCMWKFIHNAITTFRLGKICGTQRDWTTPGRVQ